MRQEICICILLVVSWLCRFKLNICSILRNGLPHVSTSFDEHRKICLCQMRRNLWSCTTGKSHLSCSKNSRISQKSYLTAAHRPNCYRRYQTKGIYQLYSDDKCELTPRDSVIFQYRPNQTNQIHFHFFFSFSSFHYYCPLHIASRHTTMFRTHNSYRYYYYTSKKFIRLSCPAVCTLPFLYTVYTHKAQPSQCK